MEVAPVGEMYTHVSITGRYEEPLAKNLYSQLISAVEFMVGGKWCVISGTRCAPRLSSRNLTLLSSLVLSVESTTAWEWLVPSGHQSRERVSFIAGSRPLGWLWFLHSYCQHGRAAKSFADDILRITTLRRPWTFPRRRLFWFGSRHLGSRSPPLLYGHRHYAVSGILLFNLPTHHQLLLFLFFLNSRVSLLDKEDYLWGFVLIGFFSFPQENYGSFARFPDVTLWRYLPMLEVVTDYVFIYETGPDSQRTEASYFGK